MLHLIIFIFFFHRKFQFKNSRVSDSDSTRFQLINKKDHGIFKTLKDIHVSTIIFVQIFRFLYTDPMSSV